MFPAARWIPAVFGTAVFVYGGWPFIQGARREIQDRLPGMMTLTALAISSRSCSARSSANLLLLRTFPKRHHARPRQRDRSRNQR
jgi:cation transport ATPase